MKVRTLVVYEDEKPEIERAARSAAERLDPSRHEVTVRAASAVTIPDILAASRYLLGADSPRSPAYAEFARVLSGINLAGRKAAFFGSNGAAVAWLRQVCADSELQIPVQDLVPAKPEASAFAAWLRSVD